MLTGWWHSSGGCDRPVGNPPAFFKAHRSDTALIAKELKAKRVAEATILSAVIVAVSNELKAISCPQIAEVCRQPGLDLIGVKQLYLWVSESQAGDPAILFYEGDQ